MAGGDESSAKIFLAGPPLVKAAIGEDATDEELGGAQMHATVSGLVEYVAEDDAHGIALARDVFTKLGWESNSDAPRDFEPPAYSAEELLGLVPADPRHPYDARELIARLVDGSDFLEFKAGFGSETVCGRAMIEGHPIGIVANNGPIQPEGSVKAAQFIQLCCQSNTPIVYLQNTTGYMVGRDAEQRGAIKHGAKMIQAVSNATVPQITIIFIIRECGTQAEPCPAIPWTVALGDESDNRLWICAKQATRKLVERALAVAV